MKKLVISDIHGSLYYSKMIPEIIKNENINELIILGDLYYHGPRNPLTDEYNPMEVAKILNEINIKKIIIKGNCDALVDEMISNFKFNDYFIEENCNKKIYYTHGHNYNIDLLPNVDFDILIYGHYHTHFMLKKDNKIFINPGSISLPKNNTKHSYLIIDENNYILKDIDENIIDSIVL